MIQPGLREDLAVPEGSSGGFAFLGVSHGKCSVGDSRSVVCVKQACQAVFAPGLSAPTLGIGAVNPEHTPSGLKGPELMWIHARGNITRGG